MGLGAIQYTQGANQEPQVTVSLGEVLELLRLATKIESPTVVFRKDDNLAMASEVIESSIHNAKVMIEILYQWTHKS